MVSSPKPPQPTFGPLAGPLKNPDRQATAKHDCGCRSSCGGLECAGWTTRSLFSYVSLEERIATRHPLRKVVVIVNAALEALDAEFAQL